MAKWWKDRDKFFPVPSSNPPRHHDAGDPEDQTLPMEDIGDVAHDDDYDELDDVEPPERGVDS